MKAIILAAGKGERLKPLTDTLSKPMLKIDNKPVLEYLILLCKKYGINEIGINTSYLPEKIKQYFEDGSKFGVKITYSFEQKLLGTSGALNNFKKFLDSKEPFLVIYGDNVTDINIEEMYEFHKKNKSFATLALRKKPISKKPGSLIFVDSNLRITNFIEKPSDMMIFKKLCKDFYLSNSGIYILDPKILDFIPKEFSDFAYDIFPKLIKEKKPLFGFIIEKYYFRHIGEIEKYNLAKEEIELKRVRLNI
jgi:mannose-1-phosphate guanylyltransferase/phosphomannomutase